MKSANDANILKHVCHLKPVALQTFAGCHRHYSNPVPMILLSSVWWYDAHLVLVSGWIGPWQLTQKWKLFHSLLTRILLQTFIYLFLLWHINFCIFRRFFFIEWQKCLIANTLKEGPFLSLIFTFNSKQNFTSPEPHLRYLWYL